jgi:hypothetical protein
MIGYSHFRGIISHLESRAADNSMFLVSELDQRTCVAARFGVPARDPSSIASNRTTDSKRVVVFKYKKPGVTIRNCRDSPNPDRFSFWKKLRTKFVPFLTAQEALVLS